LDYFTRNILGGGGGGGGGGQEVSYYVCNHQIKFILFKNEPKN